jgi:hypothetical protein
MLQFNCSQVRFTRDLADMLNSSRQPKSGQGRQQRSAPYPFGAQVGTSLPQGFRPRAQHRGHFALRLS